MANTLLPKENTAKHIQSNNTKNVIKTVFLEFLINKPINTPVTIDSIELINENRKL